MQKLLPHNLSVDLNFGHVDNKLKGEKGEYEKERKGKGAPKLSYRCSWKVSAFKLIIRKIIEGLAFIPYRWPEHSD